MSGFLSGWNLLPEVPGALDKAISKVVRKHAFMIQRLAMLDAPVDTGFLKNSIYTVTHNSSNYDSAETRSGKRNSDAEMLPEVDAPPDERTAYVAVGANYGIYVEMGTANAPAQPYLTPAAELVRPQYLAAMQSLEGLLLTGLGGGGSIDVSGEEIGMGENLGDEEPF